MSLFCAAVWREGRPGELGCGLRHRGFGSGAGPHAGSSGGSGFKTPAHGLWAAGLWVTDLTTSVSAFPHRSAGIPISTFLQGREARSVCSPSV